MTAGDSLQRWAHVMRELRTLRKYGLKANGLTERDLANLELEAMHDMNGANEVETEFGKVCKTLEYAGSDCPPVVTGLKLVPTKKENL